MPTVYRYPPGLWLTAAWTAAGIALFLVLPLIAPALLPLCLVAPLAWYWIENRRLPRHSPTQMTIALALTGLYLLINATWSQSPGDAYRSVALFFVIVVVLHLTLTLLYEVEDAPLRAMAIGFLASLMLAGGFLCIEMLSAQWTRRLLMSYAPALRPSPRHMQVVAEQVTFLAPYLLNRSIAMLTLLLWPAVFIITQLRPPGRQRLWLLAGLAPSVAAIALSVHATSKMALIGSAAVFGLFQYLPPLGRRITAVAYAAAIVLVVPIALLAYANNLYTASWLPFSAQQRIVIWKHTAEQIAKTPVFGAGISTARGLADTDYKDLPRAPGTNFPLTTGLHSHNAYLQVWYETGAFGALVLLALGLLLLHRLSRAPPDVQPYFYAVFVACALMGASSFSIWQPWFMVALSLAAIFTALGGALHAKQT